MRVLGMAIAASRSEALALCQVEPLERNQVSSSRTGMDARTNRTAKGSIAVVVAAALAYWTPNAARACGGTGASWTLLTIDGTKVMEGTQVLKLYQYGFTAELATTRFTLRALPAGASMVVIPVSVRPTSVPHLFEIELGARAIERASYALEIVGKAGGDSDFTTTLRFEGTPAPAIPQSLGTLRVGTRERGRLELGGCGAGRDGVQVVLELDSSADAVPWERQAEHQLLVDGQGVFEPEMALIDYVTRPKALRVRAMAYCTAMHYGGGELFVDAIDVELAPGQHEMRWQTRYRDGTELVSNPVQVDLRCDADPLFAPDAGQNPVVTPDAGMIVPLADGGMGERVGAAVAAVQSPTAVPAPNAPQDVQGCAVHATRHGGAGWIPAWLLAFVARFCHRGARRTTQAPTGKNRRAGRSNL
jgi:hypothetical protein